MPYIQTLKTSSSYEIMDTSGEAFMEKLESFQKDKIIFKSYKEHLAKLLETNIDLKNRPRYALQSCNTDFKNNPIISK